MKRVEEKIHFVRKFMVTKKKKIPLSRSSEIIHASSSFVFLLTLVIVFIQIRTQAMIRTVRGKVTKTMGRLFDFSLEA